MKHKFYFLSFLFIFIANMHLSMAQIVYPDFESSMLREKIDQNPSEEQYQRRVRLLESRNTKYKEMFRRIYETNSELAKTSLDEKGYKIPKIIHQIWLGKDPIPEMCVQWMQSWARLKGWTYKLWTDEDIAKMTLHNRDLFENAENYGEKTDIIRLEILKKYGGVYADVDYECLRPEIFDELNKCYDFYIGFEPLEHGSIGKFNMFKVCNALMASCPEHPLVKDFIINLKANFYAYKNTSSAIERTGPSYLTRLICAYEKSEAASQMHRNIYLPTTFFYAYSEPEMKKCFAENRVPDNSLPEIAGQHYWSGTWRPQSFNTDTYFYDVDNYYYNEE